VTVLTDVINEIEDAYPLAALQAGMLFHSEYLSGTATYHDVFTVLVRGRYDRAALDRALAETVSHHAVLRTSFNIADFSEPLQLVHRHVDARVTEVDVTGIDHAAAREALFAWREEEKHRPFDLSTPPLFRAFVHRLPDELYAATLSFHHAILDGWSVAQLASELLARYTACLDGAPLPVEPLPLTYRDFVAAERAVIESSESTTFWRTALADAPLAQVPRMPGFPLGAPEEIAVVEALIEEDVLAALEQVARSLRVPLRSVVFAAHLRVMALITGTVEPVCGLVTHGREEHEVGERVLGLFLNTVPLRVRVDQPTWSELIRAVFAAQVGLLPHRQFPIFEIQRTTGRSPLFETLLDYRDFHVYDVRRPGRSPVSYVEQFVFEQTNLPLAAAFSTLRNDKGLALLLTYDHNTLTAEQVESIRDLHLRVLNAIATDASSDPRATGSLLAHDIERITQWNSTDATFDGPVALGEWIARQASLLSFPKVLSVISSIPLAAQTVPIRSSHGTKKAIDTRWNRKPHRPTSLKRLQIRPSLIPVTAMRQVRPASQRRNCFPALTTF